MPIFEYECEECNHRFEFLQFRSDEKVNCPKCNSEKVSRQFSVFGLLSGKSRSSDSSSSSKCSGCSSHKCASCK